MGIVQREDTRSVRLEVLSIGVQKEVWR